MSIKDACTKNPCGVTKIGIRELSTQFAAYSLCTLHPQGVGRGCLEKVLAPSGGKGLKPQHSRSG